MAALASAQEPQKDALWWTELEFRRLANVVAEMLHARRPDDRKQLRVYLDAMRRKALRVLHRAESVSDGTDTTWHGLDATLHDPVAMAEEYVRAVERYETEFASFVPSPPPSPKHTLEPTTPNGVEHSDLLDEWETRDAADFAQAVAREKQRDCTEGRSALLGTASSALRQRTRSKLSEADHQFMARHQPVQEQLTAQLADAVGKLKGSVSKIGEQLESDNAVVDDTADAVDANVDGIRKQRADLAKLERSSSISWWTLLLLTVVVLSVFVFVLLVLSVPM